MTVWQPEDIAGHAPYCVAPYHNLLTYCSASEAEPATMRGQPSRAWWRDHLGKLGPDVPAVYAAIETLNRQGRTTNNSQVASHAGISTKRVAAACLSLRSHGLIRDVSKGAAYHWRIVK